VVAIPLPHDSAWLTERPRLQIPDEPSDHKKSYLSDLPRDGSGLPLAKKPAKTQVVERLERPERPFCKTSDNLLGAGLARPSVGKPAISPRYTAN
jgi:hypothetical protein